jgi:membrane fusion protein, multidrug efflux system
MKQVLVQLLVASSVAMASCSGQQSTDNAQLETDISPITSKINGTVNNILVEDNQVVKEGDTIMILDDAASKIALKQAELAVLTAKKNISLAKSNKEVVAVNVNAVTANTTAIAANLYAAKANVDAAKVKLAASDKNFQRFKNLLEQKSVTQQQFDGVKAERDANEQLLKIAEGQVLALQQQIAAAKTQISSTAANANPLGEGVGLAELNVRQAEINLEAAQLQLSYCVITAPCSGVISKKNVQKGQVVAAGQPLLAITSNTNIWVVANFKETQVKDMKVGQEATIEVEAYDKTLKGTIASFSQATGAKFSLLPADNATGNFVKVTQRIPVKIIITDKVNEYPLRAGMSVSVNVKTK